MRAGNVAEAPMTARNPFLLHPTTTRHWSRALQQKPAPSWPRATAPSASRF